MLNSKTLTKSDPHQNAAALTQALILRIFISSSLFLFCMHAQRAHVPQEFVGATRFAPLRPSADGVRERREDEDDEEEEKTPTAYGPRCPNFARAPKSFPSRVE